MIVRCGNILKCWKISDFPSDFIDALQTRGQFDADHDDVALLVFLEAVNATNHG
jgi:hypothetical protein